MKYKKPCRYVFEGRYIDDTKVISLNALVFGEGNPEYRSISKTEQECDKGSSYSISKEKKKGKNLQRHN